MKGWRGLVKCGWPLAWMLMAVAAHGGDWYTLGDALNKGTNQSGGWASAVVGRPGGTETLFVGYEQYINNNSLQLGPVLRWNGNWTAVGDNLNTHASADAMVPALAMDSGNRLCAGYLDYNGGYNILNKRLNGTAWDWIGSSLNASSLYNGYVTETLAADHQTDSWLYNAYSVYNDVVSNYEITINRWNGTSWDAVLGTVTIDHSAFPTHSLAVSNSNQPFLAWYDLSPAPAVHVRTWVGAAPTGFPDAVFKVPGAPEGKEPKLFNTPTEGLFLAFVGTGGANNVIAVMRYNGTSWSQIGASGDLVATPDGLSSPCLAMDNQQRLHVAWLQASAPDYVWKLRARIREGGAWHDLGGQLNVTANRSAYNPSLVMLNNLPVAVWDELDPGGNTRNVWAKQWLPTGPPTPTPTVAAVPPSGETTAYPLPAATTVNFGFNGTETGAVTVRVYNTHYRMVKELAAETATGTGSVAWDVSAVAPGVYLYQITVGGQKFPAQKLVIAR